jgi:carboxyl-terminal processing protease
MHITGMKSARTWAKSVRPPKVLLLVLSLLVFGSSAVTAHPHTPKKDKRVPALSPSGGHLAVPLPNNALPRVPAAARDVQTPGQIAKGTVDAIDGAYLYSSDPAWQKVRAEILAETAADSDHMYALIRTHLASLHDPELHIVTPSELAAIDNESKGNHVGTGLIDFSIDEAPATSEGRVVTPLIGSPAAVAGVRPGDVIMMIDRKPTRDLDHEGLLDRIRSAATTELLLRRGRRRIHVRLTPSDKPVQPVVARLLPTHSGSVGYLRIVQFTPAVPDAVLSAMTSSESSHPSGYILDLRNDPGGFLDAAASVGGMFVSGTLGFKVRQNGSTEPIMATGEVITKAPVVVLVNEGTASAAEFLAAALRSHGRATLVGMPTYGRGQAQIYKALSDGYGVIMPSALIRTIDGRTFKGNGLEPDVRVPAAPLVAPEINVASDRQLQRAIDLISRMRGLTD